MWHLNIPWISYHCSIIRFYKESTMFNAEKNYYYKEVEKSAGRLSELLEELNAYFDNAALNELIELLSDIPWHKLSTENSEVKEENLTDDQKEIIALGRKGWHKEIEDCRIAMSPYITTVKAFYENVYALYKIFNKAFETILKYDFGAVKELCDGMSPLMLTSKELYHALTFLNLNQIRTLLADQTPIVFNRMLSAFQKGENEFMRLVDNLDYAPMPGLRDILMVELEKVSSFLDFVKAQTKSDPDLRSLIVEDMCEEFNCDISFLTTSCGFDFSVETLEVQQKLLNDYFQNQASCLYHSNLLTVSDKRKVNGIYEDWRNNNSSYAPLDECDLSGISDKLNRIIVNQTDKWMLSVIHDRMTQELDQIEDGDNIKEQSTTIVDYLESFATQAPNITYETMRNIAARLAGKVMNGNTIVQSQVAYIKASDISRLCYFLLHEICPPDNISKVDFSQPIWWYGDWKSLKYFVNKLYREPKSFPQNLSREIVQTFRFKRTRKSPKLSKGEIAFTTFNNSRNINSIVKDNDRSRINAILKEFGLLIKA